MAKKKRKNRLFKKLMPLLFIGGGVALAFFAQDWFGKTLDNYLSGVGLKFRRIKAKFTGSLFTIPVINLKVPRFLTLYTEVTITNDNPFGGAVQNFTGKLRYGKGGTEISPLTSGAFNLPAKGSVDTTWISQLDLTSKPGDILNIIREIKGGELKKLWVEGTLKTNIVNLPVSAPVELLSEK